MSAEVATSGVGTQLPTLRSKHWSFPCSYLGSDFRIRVLLPTFFSNLFMFVNCIKVGSIYKSFVFHSFAKNEKSCRTATTASFASTSQSKETCWDESKSPTWAYHPRKRSLQFSGIPQFFRNRYEKAKLASCSHPHFKDFMCYESLKLWQLAQAGCKHLWAAR